MVAIFWISLEYLVSRHGPTLAAVQMRGQTPYRMGRRAERGENPAGYLKVYLLA